MESFSDKLKSLGFKVASSLPKPLSQMKIPLEDKIDGSVIKNSLGSFVLKTSLYPRGYKHGSNTLDEEFLPDSLNKAAKINRQDIPVENLVFLDTETSGISGGTGTFAFLVGMGRFKQGGFLLDQLIIRDPLEEGAMLLHLSNCISPDDVFVTFNGKSFDLPILNNRLRINRLPVIFHQNAHLDLLHISRKIWRRQLQSCALKDLERDVLSISRTDEDIPGWMIPEIYFEYLRTGEPEKISNVIYHNDLDIVSLAALFIHITKLMHLNSKLDRVSSGDLVAIGKIFTDIDARETALSIYLHCLDQNLPAGQFAEVNKLVADLNKKEGIIKSAVPYWIASANGGNLDACIELSMFYEHQERDNENALKWAYKASSTIMTGKISNAALNHRISRLERKTGKNV